ncbi:MAG: DUF86 domain-containing protein [Methanoregula sp.]|jgi:uncharacterized protein YutE (UPF0331/DUF86 family)|uniref:type VII toxin-antitoxin system HepT family RNase toxin n=1 Tax=Methanoregula sp. TaxID=2052170 RepID=UPI003C13EC26
MTPSGPGSVTGRIPFDDLAQKKDTQYMVCHALLLSIQASVDIATGIAVMKTPRRPDTYRETFQLLGYYRIIPEDLAKELSRLAGFRNILVHEYTTLDIPRVYRVLQDDLETMKACMDIVKAFIKENKKAE